jgi:hypothetical protein
MDDHAAALRVGPGSQERALKIRTYVVPLDNIWSGSAFRNMLSDRVFP